MKTTALKARLRAHILSGGALKEFASDEKLHPTTPGKMLEGLGIRKVFLTEEERETVAKMRRESALAQRNGVPAERDQLRDEVGRLTAACDKFSNGEITQGDWKSRAERAEAELAAERAKTADCGLTIASLCDGILGEDFADRSDQMLIRVGCRMKAELAAEREKVRVLRSALQDLCDEQNGAPLERRREQWQEAMDKAVAALALSPYT